MGNGNQNSIDLTKPFYSNPLLKPLNETHRTCPACRGYDLEKQWCNKCNGSGLCKK